MPERVSTPALESNLEYWQRKLERAQTDVDIAERQVAAWTRKLEQRRAADRLERDAT